MFSRLEVIVLTNKQTNKQTPLKTCNALHYESTTVGKHDVSSSVSVSHRVNGVCNDGTNVVVFLTLSLILPEILKAIQSTSLFKHSLSVFLLTAV